MFGHEPPPELILANKIDDENILTPTDQDSISTLISLASQSLLSFAPTLATNRPRSDSDASSCASDAPMLVDEPSFGYIPELDAFKLPSLDPSNRPFYAQPPPVGRSNLALSPPSSGDPTDFHERRRRAAKLSRFFGVGYQDFSSSMERSDPPPRMPSRTPASKDEVGVKISAPGRFWGLSDGRRMRDAQMIDVIDKLRDLKAA